MAEKRQMQKEKAEKTPKNWIPRWGKVHRIQHLAELEDERTEFFNSFWGMHYSRRKNIENLLLYLWGSPRRILKWERKIRIRKCEAVSTCVREDKHKDQRQIDELLSQEKYHQIIRKFQTNEKIQKFILLNL